MNIWHIVELHVIYFSEELWHSDVKLQDVELKCQDYNYMIYHYIITRPLYMTW